MNWFKQAAASVEAKLQEAGVSQKLAGVSEKLAPVANVAMETGSLFSSLTSTLEQSFNKVSSGPGDEHTAAKTQPFENEIKGSILKITEGESEEVCKRLMERPADEDVEFNLMDPTSTARAMAALEADPRLQEVRHKLVPGELKEDAFWRNYFYKCDLIIASFLKMSSRDPVGPAASSSPSAAAAAGGGSSPAVAAGGGAAAKAGSAAAVAATARAAAAAGSPAPPPAASSPAPAPQPAAAKPATPTVSSPAPAPAPAPAAAAAVEKPKAETTTLSSWEQEMANELAGIDTGGSASPVGGAADACAAGVADAAADAAEEVIDDDDFEKELGL